MCFFVGVGLAIVSALLGSVCDFLGVDGLDLMTGFRLKDAISGKLNSVDSADKKEDTDKSEKDVYSENFTED